MLQPRSRVLVVDDERPALDELAFLLGRDDRVGEVLTCDSATEALRLLQELEVDAVFLDIQMPGLPASSWPRCWPASRPRRRSCSSPPTSSTPSTPSSCDAVDYVLKPVRERAAGRGGTPGGRGRRHRPRPPADEQIPVERGGVTRFVSRSEITLRRGAGRLRPAAHRARAPTCSGRPLSTLEEEWARRRVRAHPPLAAGLARPHRRGPHGGRPLHGAWSAGARAGGQPAPHPRAARPAAAAGLAEHASHEPPPPRAGPRHRPPRRGRGARAPGPATSTPRPGSATIYMGSLLREQLRAGGGCSAAARPHGRLLPLLFRLAPGWPDSGPRHAAGLAAARRSWSTRCWSLLGWFYVRRAERNERDFTDLRGEALTGDPTEP